MILIYSSIITKRLTYTCEFVFNRVLQVDFRITDQSVEYLGFPGAKICYDRGNLDDGLYLQPASLLLEEDVRQYKIEVKEWAQLPVFFSVNRNSFLPFDIFSAIFYMITRYEEYLPHSQDRHQRFNVEDSLAFRHGFLERPIVNLWIRKMADLLVARYHELYIPPVAFNIATSIDIDNAYSFQHRGLVRNGFSLAKDVFMFRLSSFKGKLAMLTGRAKDPFDSYEKQERIHAQYNLQAKYFVLLGDFAKYDQNLSHNNQTYRRLIERLSKHSDVGLHPSYESNRDRSKLIKEKGRLEKIVNNEVVISRQHYIKIKFPDTYRSLIDLGIREDYSMGFPSHSGFRAGTSTPFLFFDLKRGEVTSLLVHPFCVMDTTLKKYQNIMSKDVVSYVSKFIEEIAQSGGEFGLVFHNESIGGAGYWKNWAHVYENILKVAVAKLR